MTQTETVWVHSRPPQCEHPGEAPSRTRSKTFLNLTSSCWRPPCALPQVPSFPSLSAPLTHRLCFEISIHGLPGWLAFTGLQGEHPPIPSPACIHEQRHRWHFTVLKGRETRSAEFTFCVLTHGRERPGTGEQGGDKETR